MKTHWESGGIDPCIFNLGTKWRWVAIFMPQLLYLYFTLCVLFSVVSCKNFRCHLQDQNNRGHYSVTWEQWHYSVVRWMAKVTQSNYSCYMCRKLIVITVKLFCRAGTFCILKTCNYPELNSMPEW